MGLLARAATPSSIPARRLCDRGDTVTVVLNNTLAYAVSIVFPGQENVLANGVPAQPVFDGGNLMSLTPWPRPTVAA